LFQLVFSPFPQSFERVLPEIFEHSSEVLKRIDGKMKSESFKQKIMGCIRAWQDWAIYPSEYLLGLQNRFLGLAKPVASTDKEADKEGDKEEDSADSDVDGKPLEEEEEEEEAKSKFVSSKWETVDPEALEKQAVTTSKWDFFDEEQQQSGGALAANSSLRSLEAYGDEEGDLDGKPMEEEEEEEDVDGRPMQEGDEGEDVDGRPMAEARSWMDEMGVREEEKRRILREIEVGSKGNLRNEG